MMQILATNWIRVSGTMPRRQGRPQQGNRCGAQGRSFIDNERPSKAHKVYYGGQSSGNDPTERTKGRSLPSNDSRRIRYHGASSLEGDRREAEDRKAFAIRLEK